MGEHIRVHAKRASGSNLRHIRLRHSPVYLSPPGVGSPSVRILCLGFPKDYDCNTLIVIFVDRSNKMAHSAALPGLIDGKGTAMLLSIVCFVNRGCHWKSSLIATLALPANFRLPPSRFLVRDWTCPQRIIRRPMIKLSELIASSAMFFVVFVLGRHGLGARCSPSFNSR